MTIDRPPLFAVDETPTPSAMDGWATISDDGLYRYRLGRRWDHNALSGPAPVLFIMLNPSIADGAIDDMTVTKCCGFAHRWGYGGIDVVNHFAYRAQDPDDLIAAHRAGVDVRGPLNAATVVEAMEDAGLVVAAWGGTIRGVEKAGARPLIILTLARELGITVHAIGRPTTGGDPRHPSRIGYDAPLRELR
jgi:hypothetical protein